MKTHSVWRKVKCKMLGKPYRAYGWKKDKPDNRDKQWALKFKVAAPPPVSASNKDLFSTPYNQGQIGQCTGEAVDGVFDAERKAQGKGWMFPSAMFPYYNGRMLEGTTNQDAGASIRDVVKQIVKLGICKESTWPSVPKNITRKPSAAAYKEALANQVLTYYSIDTTNSTLMKQTIAGGHSIVCGIMIYESFESALVAKTGIVPMPKARERLMGGHAVVICGYKPGYYLMRNSWGVEWGLSGYCWLPEAFVNNSRYTMDGWVITLVEAA